MTKKTFKVEGMHCTSCAMVIESDLEDVGVKAACSYAKATLETEFDEKKTGEGAIKKIIQQLGYKIY
jgi:copper chaperone CopZ